MAAKRDIVIVGAGHNGLVAAFYLARAGLKPLVLERRPVVGGTAITDEFYPRFKCSTLSHATGPLHREIWRDMQLERHGLVIIHPEVQVFAPSPDGRPLFFHADPSKSTQAIAGFCSKDAERYREFLSAVARIGGYLRPLLASAPPDIDHPGTQDLWQVLKLGRGFRRLGKKDGYRLLRWAPMPVADVVAEWFESELLRATIAARGIFGSFCGPWSPGSGAVMLLRAAVDGHPAGASQFPRGGMGGLAQALASAARQAGAEIRTDAEVAGIIVKNGSTTGVTLQSGEEIAAKVVVSNADPRRTFLRLVDPVHLEPGFVVKMQHYRCRGTTAKVNLALAGLPAFRALEAMTAEVRSAAVAGRIHIGPALEYLEHAFDDAKYGEYSREPYLDITIPSVLDPSLVPPGRHVMSIYVQFAPFRLRNGDWSSRRDALGDTVVKTLSRYASNLPELILHRQVITPQDLEETYGLTGGHILHGEPALDQLFTMRPLLGWARYRTPVRGLYLCGSGTHPGLGLTGDSGRNAAREILKDLRR